jgi:arylsulfatase
VVSNSHYLYLGEGWSDPEGWGTWAMGTTARILVSWSSPERRTMLLRGWALRHPDHRDGQRVTVIVNGVDCGSVSFGKRSRNAYLEIAESAQRAGINEVVFRFAYHISPAELGMGEDDRQLAAGIKTIGFAAGSNRPRAPSSLSRRLAILRNRLGLATAIVAADGAAGTLTVHRAGTVIVTESACDSEDRPRLTISAPAELEPESTSIRISHVGLSGNRSPPSEPPAEAWHLDADEGTLSLAVDTAHVPWTRGLVLIEVDPRPIGIPLTVSSPHLRAPDHPAPPRIAEPQPARETEAHERPDVVLITLDAARADHVGCYGYQRPTTPHIDALAAEALVFPHAFAHAPYTLCSVPTMITGLSFPHHGVVAKGHRLSPQAWTLAELLADLGYRTACYSATPNNSRSKGFDQGYETFVEMWSGVKSAAARDPQRLAAAALQWIDSQPTDQPLHLQLHFVPPHEPYDPPPRFDVFGEPDYDGEYDGTLATLKAIDGRARTPTERDLREIVSLYDGNLLRADHAVGLVLDGLRRRERWNKTVVLITSDHGEAFLEHDRMSHNSTVYDEMLHVPFILRLPPGWPTTARTDEMITLTDIVPTLVGVAGGRLPAAVDGLDLLAVESSSGTSCDRFFVTRTAHDSPVLGLRTARWKIILSRNSRWELYDIVDDPREAHNVLYQQAPIAAGLANLIWQEVHRPPLFGDPGDSAEVDADDAAMLRALGYAD